MSRTCSVILHVYIQMYHHVNASFFGSKDVYCMVTLLPSTPVCVTLFICKSVCMSAAAHIYLLAIVYGREHMIFVGGGAALFHHS